MKREYLTLLLDILKDEDGSHYALSSLFCFNGEGNFSRYELL